MNAFSVVNTKRAVKRSLAFACLEITNQNHGMDKTENRRARLREFFANRSIPPKEKSYLSQLMTGKASFGEKAARRLETDYGMGAGYLDKEAGKQSEAPSPSASPLLRPIDEVEPGPDIIGKIRNLPIVGQVQAGPDGLLTVDDYPVGHGDGYVPYWATSENAYALRVRGESMSPRYLPGEFVAVDPSSEVQPSQEVIVLKVDGTRMIKRLLWMRDGQACFESINKDYKNITLYMEEIQALHRVMGGVPKEAFRSGS